MLEKRKKIAYSILIAIILFTIPIYVLWKSNKTENMNNEIENIVSEKLKKLNSKSYETQNMNNEKENIKSKRPEINEKSNFTKNIVEYSNIAIKYLSYAFSYGSSICIYGINRVYESVFPKDNAKSNSEKENIKSEKPEINEESNFTKNFVKYSNITIEYLSYAFSYCSSTCIYGINLVYEYLFGGDNAKPNE